MPDRATVGGPQRRLRGPRGAGAGLHALALAVGVLALHAILTGNLATPEDPRLAWMWELNLFTVPAALTTLVAVVSLLMVRRQFVMGTRPYLTITSVRCRESKTGLADGTWWQATLHNVGPGTAVMSASRFRVALARTPHHSTEIDASAVRVLLADCGSVSGKHFGITHLSSGFAFGPGQTLVMFEGGMQCLDLLARLELRLEYEGMLGDLFARDISLLPSDPVLMAVD